MKKLLVAFSCAFLLGGLGVGSASAATFNWSFTGVDTGSGTFTANPTATAGTYSITGITGTITGPSFGTQTILGLIPVGAFPYPTVPADSNDNLLYFPAIIPPTDPLYQTQPSYLDINGVSFYLGLMGNCSLATPVTGCFNLYYGNDAGNPLQNPSLTGYNLFYPNETGNDLLASFTVTPAAATAATPEPGSLILMGTGVTGLAGLLRRRLVRA